MVGPIAREAIAADADADAVIAAVADRRCRGAWTVQLPEGLDALVKGWAGSGHRVHRGRGDAVGQNKND